jgi:hypothetical protein
MQKIKIQEPNPINKPKAAFERTMDELESFSRLGPHISFLGVDKVR